jgi:rRNA maturation RNase YbeY
MISVLINSESRYKFDRRRVRETVCEILGKEGIKDGEVSISVVGRRKTREISKKYLGCQEEHEVLSFCLEDPGTSDAFVMPPDGRLRLGDIILSYPDAVKMAREQNKMVDDEVIFLVAHGCEHLLGRHHS